MSRRTLVATVACAAAFWVGACDSDEPEQNPSFSTGEAGAPAGGQGEEPGTSGSGGSSAGSGGKSAAISGGEGGAPAPSMAGAPPIPVDTAGAAGAPPEVPPYDCVLHPTLDSDPSLTLPVVTPAVHL